jgi:tetratricopeptide (TPR) repeat protein
VAEQVETIDIFPTVAELTGAAFQHPIEGHSLVPLLDGGRWEERPAYSESMVPLLVNGWAPPRSVHTRELQYIRAPRPELYDLVADAAELHNVAAQRPEDLARMQKELERLVARAEGARIESAQANLSEAERSMLASLGYLQSDAKPAPAQELDPKELELPDPKDYVRAASQYLMMGITSLMHQDPKEAERLFRKYLEVDRNSSEGRFYLGLAVRDQGRLEEALGIMREAQQRNPESFNATLHLGILNLILGHREEARPWLEKAIELNPYSGEPLFVLGTLMEDEGERAKALDLYDRALAIDKGNSTIHMRKGFLLLHMGRKQEGEAALHQAVELAPRTPQARQRLAARFQQEGRPDLAQPLLERP